MLFKYHFFKHNIVVFCFLNLQIEPNEGALEIWPERSKFKRHDAFSFVKCCECLAFLVRNIAHITPYNFTKCVSVIKNFAWASLQSSMINFQCI